MQILSFIGARLMSGLGSLFKFIFPFVFDKAWAYFVEWYKTKKEKEEREKVNQQNVEADNQAMEQGTVDEIAQSSIDLLNGNKRPK